MHARIMLLPGTQAGKQMCSHAEQILTDVSAAFNHSFSLRSEKIGQDSLNAYDEALTEETVEACRACQAVFLGDGACEGADDLYDALDLPIRIRSFSVPKTLCKSFESPVSLWLAQMFSIDAQTLREGTQQAFRFAQETEAAIRHVPPAGAARGEWEAAVRVQEAAHPLVAVSSLAAPDAMTGLVQSPDQMGVLLCPPYAGSIFDAAARALAHYPALIHDASFHQHIGVYAPLIAHSDASPCLEAAGAALAVAKLLRFSLGLSLEAGCVEAAVDNVLSSDDWADDCVDRICDQISVAGELMYKSPLSH